MYGALAEKEERHSATDSTFYHAGMPPKALLQHVTCALNESLCVWACFARVFCTRLHTPQHTHAHTPLIFPDHRDIGAHGHEQHNKKTSLVIAGSNTHPSSPALGTVAWCPSPGPCSPSQSALASPHSSSRTCPPPLDVSSGPLASEPHVWLVQVVNETSPQGHRRHPAWAPAAARACEAPPAWLL